MTTPESNPLMWGASIRAVAQSRSYEHYLELMAQAEADIAAAVDQAVAGE